MICPHCNRYAPDGNYKCPGCGKIIKADTDLIEKYQAPEPTGARKKVRTNPTTVILIVVILGGLGILANLMLKHKEKVKTQPLENQAIVETQQPAETASVQDEPVETGDLPQAPLRAARFHGTRKRFQCGTPGNRRYGSSSPVRRTGRVYPPAGTGNQYRKFCPGG